MFTARAFGLFHDVGACTLHGCLIRFQLHLHSQREPRRHPRAGALVVHAAIRRYRQGQRTDSTQLGHAVMCEQPYVQSKFGSVG